MSVPTTCAVCHKPLPPEVDPQSALFPFCSKRCKQIDLFRWTEGKYAVVDPLTPEKLLEELERSGAELPE